MDHTSINFFSFLTLVVSMCFYQSHQETRCRTDVVTTFLCTFQQRHRHVSNEIPNDVLVERRENVSVVCLRYLIMAFHKDITMTPHQYVATTSQTSHKWNTQWHFTGMLPRGFSGTYSRHPIRRSLQRLLQLPNETINNVVVVHLHHVPELRCREDLLVGLIMFSSYFVRPLSDRFPRLI